MIDYTNFRGALKNLQDYWALHANTAFNGENPKQKELEQMGIIQAYEVCYEAMMKTLRRYLTEETGMTEMSNKGAKPIIRAAAENQLLGSPVEDWLQYVNFRNASSHDYGIDKLQNILQSIPGFIDAAINLYKTMSQQPWE